MAEGLARRVKGLVAPLVSVTVVRRFQITRNRYRLAQQRRFDRRHGTDTAAYLEPERMQVPDAASVAANRYEATGRSTVRRLVRGLPGDVSDTTFVDVGSGKGAVLLYLSDHPFRRLVGVEHDPGLHRIARANLERWAALGRGSTPIEVECADALEWDLPDGPLVIFMSNPFDPASMERFMGRCRASLAADPRPMTIMTFNRGAEGVLDAQPWLEPADRGWNHASYVARPERAA